MWLSAARNTPCAHTLRVHSHLCRVFHYGRRKMDFNGFFWVSVYFTLASFCQIFILTNKKKKLRSMLHYILREKTPERNFFFLHWSEWMTDTNQFLSVFIILSSVNGSVKMSTYAQTVVLCLFLVHKKTKTHGSKSICFCYFTYASAGSVKKNKTRKPQKVTLLFAFWQFCFQSLSDSISAAE